MAENQTTKRKPRKTKAESDAYRKEEMPRYRPGAKFISNGGQEYVLRQDGKFFYIHPHEGGPTPPELQGLFLNKLELEQRLISYLRKTDKNGYARYPGKESKYAPFNGE